MVEVDKGMEEVKGDRKKRKTESGANGHVERVAEEPHDFTCLYFLTFNIVTMHVEM